MNDIIMAIAEKNKNNAKEGDYVKDEILYCGKCHQPKQCIKEFPTGSGKMRKFSIVCQCDIDEENAFQERMRRQEWDDYIKQLYKQGLTDKAYLKNNFENDDNRNPAITYFCKKYVASWDKQKGHNNGVLFYGGTGGGKSFYACCIANALLKSGVRVLVSRLSDLVKNQIKNDTPEINLNSFDLIVLDDLGVEKATQTAYNIVDDIYRSDIPLIVTTNLMPTELKNPDSLEKERIYSRVLEMCCIVQNVDVKISRFQIAKSKNKQALNDLNI